MDRHRSARPRRSGALRAARLPARRVDAAARRSAGRADRSAGLRAVLGDHEARRHHADRVATASGSRARRGSRSPARARAPMPPTEILVLLDPPQPRPDAPGRERRASRPSGARAARRRRTHRARRPRRRGAGGRLGRARLRRADRGAVPARGHRVDPRRARAPTGSCCSAGPTRSSARTIPSTASPASRPARR